MKGKDLKGQQKILQSPINFNQFQAGDCVQLKNFDGDEQDYNDDFKSSQNLTTDKTSPHMRTPDIRFK